MRIGNWEGHASLYKNSEQSSKCLAKKITESFFLIILHVFQE